MGARFDRERVRESILRAATVYIERYEVRDDSAGTVEDHGHDFDGADQDFNERVDAVKARGGDPADVTLIAVLATGA